jgi:hypothetical protein
MSQSKHTLEFFPEVIFTLPEGNVGGCCLKPVAKQTERSRKMYIFAKHLKHRYRDKLDFVIPSKTETRIRAKMKWKKFKARMRMRRLGVKKLPALALDGKILFQGDQKIDGDFDLIM